jgi:hypothetical protein
MSTFWWYSSENLSPRVTASFLARQRAVLMPVQYAREHQNQWVDSAESYTTQADVDWAMGQDWGECFGACPEPGHVIGIDIGLLHDPAVIAMGHLKDGQIYICRLITFQGSRDAPVRIATLEHVTREMAETCDVSRIRIESWQGVSSFQSLTALGLPAELFAPTPKAHAEEWPILAKRLETHTLVLPRHPRLREELLNLSVELTQYGVRVIDRGSVHQDHAVAVRLVVAALGVRRCTQEWCQDPECGGVHMLGRYYRMTAAEREAEEEAATKLRAEVTAETIRSAVARQGFWWPR